MKSLLKLSFAGAFAVSISFSLPASSQSIAEILEQSFDRLAGTNSVSFTPVFSGGILMGCTLEYSAIVRDWGYRQGAFSRVEGSFGFLSSGAVVAPVLKVVVNDIDMASLSMQPAAPASASIVSGFDTNAGSSIDASESDTPGSIFIVFASDPPTSMFLDALVNEKIQLRFARREGGLDVPIDLDLTVAVISADGTRSHSDEAVKTMSECLNRLAGAEQ